LSPPAVTSPKGPGYMSSRPRKVALKTSQFPRQPSTQRVHIPLLGTTSRDRFAVLVASFAFGLCRFISIAPFLHLFCWQLPAGIAATGYRCPSGIGMILPLHLLYVNSLHQQFVPFFSNKPRHRQNCRPQAYQCSSLKLPTYDMAHCTTWQCCRILMIDNPQSQH